MMRLKYAGLPERLLFVLPRKAAEAPGKRRSAKSFTAAGRFAGSGSNKRLVE